MEGEETEREAFGVIEPSPEVRVGLEDGDSQVLLMDGQSPIGYSYYLRHEGEEAVYLEVRRSSRTRSS